MVKKKTMTTKTTKAVKKPVKPAQRQKGCKRLNLALQGGGSHGAYTWGVLDRLLEEEDIEIVGLSGTSAGAMNAAVVVDGLAEGGATRAREKLRMFWQSVSGYSSIFSPVQQTPLEQLQHGFDLNWSMAYNAFDMLSRMFSPYELNPLNVNPLRTVLENQVDIERIHAADDIGLFVTATSVETGHPRVFESDDITIDVLLASACLPTMFQAVEIEGEPFWDGGYMGNPSLWPLIYRTDCPDILLVEINPVYRPGTPKHAVDIINRLNEISFNSSLIAEMRAINFVKKLIAHGDLSGNVYKDVNMHMMGAPAAMQELTASSKVNASWEFLTFLHGVGYKAAELWLKQTKKHINQASTLDIESVFLSNKYAMSQKAKNKKQPG